MSRIVSVIVSGQLAGLIMAVVVMAVFPLFLGHGPLFPVQLIGSTIFGEAALADFHLPALLAGLALHQGAAFAWSLVFAAAASLVSARTAGASLAFGVAIGLASQLLDVSLLVPAVMEALHGRDLWAEHVPAFWSWAAHLVFGAAFALHPLVSRRLGARFAGAV